MGKKIDWTKFLVGAAIVAIPIAPPIDDAVGFAIMANALGVKL